MRSRSRFSRWPAKGTDLWFIAASHGSLDAAFGLECLALQKSSASPSKRSALDSLSDLDRERGSLDARVTLTAYWILPRHALYRLRSIYGYTRSVYGIL